ncbi:MAG: adenine deaminase [Dehalococcoidales bacterium]|nr:adenine deaminase [Dehalococcoidales bacterium]
MEQSEEKKQLIAVARGQKPADLILSNARVVNVFNGKIEPGNVAVYGGYIAGIGDYEEAKQTIDLQGKYLIPGLINGHVHIESSLLDVGQYARSVVPAGTTSLVTDLHEIANVCGLDGIRYVLDCARSLPLDVFLMAPSCVPATHLETSGASLDINDIRRILRFKECIGLGEVMNFPGVLSGDKNVLDKVEAAGGKIIDGHAPSLAGKDLNAYIAAGIGSDHESVNLAEAEEKLRRGMYVMIREGSSEKNLEALLPLVMDETYHRCFFVVDDRSCYDLLNDGDIDAVVRKAISLGLNPVRAVQMATINTAQYFRLDKLGAVAPGYIANLIVSGDLKTFPIDMVFYRGCQVGENRRALFEVPKSSRQKLTGTVKIKPFKKESLQLKISGAAMPVIEIVPGQIITRKRMEKIAVVPDTKRDILKAVVIERHNATGNIGLGLVKGFGLKRGALASSVAHDSHNIVAVGTNDDDIYLAVREIERLQGGLVVVADGRVAASLALPVAGLLSDEPLATVVTRLEKVEKAAKILGTKLSSPFATLSFLALPVIPELRLTDMGIVDVMQFKLI